MLAVVAGVALAASAVSLGVRWGEWLPPERPHDLMYFYVPGRIWLEGGSPYHVATFISHPLWRYGPNFPSGFGYQPSSWYLDLPIAALPLDVAMRVMWLLNLVWLATCGALLYGLIARALPDEPVRRRWLGGAAVLGFTGLTCVLENLSTNQGVLYFTALLLLALHLLERGRDGWAGLVFGLMLYKYSLGLWPAVALGLIRRSPRLLILPMAVHLALSAVPIFLFPTPVTYADWRDSVDAYITHATISPYYPLVTTIRAVITQCLHLPPEALANKALHALYIAVGLAAIYLTRRAYDSPRRYAWLGLNLIWTLLAGFCHTYDFVIIAPLFAGLALGYRDLRLLPASAIGLGLFMLMIPTLTQIAWFGRSVPWHALWLLLVQAGVTAWLLWPRTPNGALHAAPATGAPAPA